MPVEPAPGGSPTLAMNANLWWNGGHWRCPPRAALALPEGAASRLPQAGQGANSPIDGGTPDARHLSTLAAA